MCQPTLKEWENKWSDKDVTNLLDSCNERQQTLNGISQVNDINADSPCAGSGPSIQKTTGQPSVPTPDPIARDIIPPRTSTRGGNQTTIVNSCYLAKLEKDASDKRRIDTKLYKKSKGTSPILARRLLGLAIAAAPKVSFRVLETLIGITVAWFLT